MFYEEAVVSYSTLVPNMPRRVTLIVYEVYAFNHYGCVYVCQKLLNYRQSRNCVGVTNSGPILDVYLIYALRCRLHWCHMTVTVHSFIRSETSRFCEPYVGLRSSIKHKLSVRYSMIDTCNIILFIKQQMANKPTTWWYAKKNRT